MAPGSLVTVAMFVFIVVGGVLAGGPVRSLKCRAHLFPNISEILRLNRNLVSVFFFFFPISVVPDFRRL
jgi:hypothetical protein